MTFVTSGMPHRLPARSSLGPFARVGVRNFSQKEPRVGKGTWPGKLVME